MKNLDDTFKLYDSPEFKLWVLISQTRHGLLRCRQKELSKYGITPSQAAVLSAVKAIGKEATPAEISRWLLREPHSISRIVERMEKKGLVKKFKDLNKKNLVRVALTQEGEKSFSQSTELEKIRKIFSFLNDEQRDHLIDLLKIIRDRALEETGLKYESKYP